MPANESLSARTRPSLTLVGTLVFAGLSQAATSADLAFEAVTISGNPYTRITVVPEPSSALLGGLGLLALLRRRR